MIRRTRHVLAAVISGLTTVAAVTLLSAPMAQAATPYFTGTSSCDAVTGNEVITYVVPHPLSTFTTTDITAVNNVYTKTGTATIFTSVPTTTYPTSLAGDTLTMTVPGNVAGTYRVNLTVAITTATGPDLIMVMADAVVPGTCLVKPGEVLPTTTTIPSPTAVAPATPVPATTTATTTTPTSAAPTVKVPVTLAPATPTSSASGEVEGASLTLAATGSDVDDVTLVVGVLSLVAGGVLLLWRQRI